MKNNILAEINRVREVMGLREQLEIIPDAEGTKEDPIQGTPAVAVAEEGKYYQNTQTKQIYLFQDGKYTEIVESGTTTGTTGDDVKGKEEVAMIEGIAISDLHPYAYEMLKSQKTIGTSQMLKLMARCFDDDDDDISVLKSSGGGKGGTGQYLKAGKEGTLHLIRPNGHHEYWTNICSLPDDGPGRMPSGGWQKLEGFNWDQTLREMINDFWINQGSLKNRTWDESEPEYDENNEPIPGSHAPGTLTLDDQKARYEAGKKLIWKSTEDRTGNYILAVR